MFVAARYDVVVREMTCTCIPLDENICSGDRSVRVVVAAALQDMVYAIT